MDIFHVFQLVQMVSNCVKQITDWNWCVNTDSSSSTWKSSRSYSSILTFVMPVYKVITCTKFNNIVTSPFYTCSKWPGKDLEVLRCLTPLVMSLEIFFNFNSHVWTDFTHFVAFQYVLGSLQKKKKYLIW